MKIAQNRLQIITVFELAVRSFAALDC